MLVQLPGETEAGPVMSVLKNIQSIALEVNISIKVLLEESCHGNLALAVVFDTVMLAVELQVVLDGTTRVFSFFILAGGSSRCNGPEGHQDWDCSEDGEEDGGVEATAELASNVERHADQKDDQEDIGEAVTAGRVCWEGGILDRRVLYCNWSQSGERSTRPRSSFQGPYRRCPHSTILRGWRCGSRRSLDELKVLGGL